MDVSGLDSAYKLDILAATAFKADLQLKDIFYEGIENITLKDISYAKELGYVIKLLAIGKEVSENKMSFKVHPTMIPFDHPLAGIRNELNAVYIIGDPVGESLLAGKGAGGSPTGSAVVSDVIDIAFGNNGSNMRNLEESLHKVELLPIEETQAQFYLRVSAPDTPGTLEKITGILGTNNVSISKILQKGKIDDLAEIVIITHLVKEKNITKSVSDLKNINAVENVLSLIRVGLEESL